MKKYLELLSEEEYNHLVKSGMFFEIFPEATGNYIQDIKKNISSPKRDCIHYENVYKDITVCNNRKGEKEDYIFECDTLISGKGYLNLRPLCMFCFDYQKNNKI